MWIQLYSFDLESLGQRLSSSHFTQWAYSCLLHQLWRGEGLSFSLHLGMLLLLYMLREHLCKAWGGNPRAGTPVWWGVLWGTHLCQATGHVLAGLGRDHAACSGIAPAHGHLLLLQHILLLDPFLCWLYFTWLWAGFSWEWTLASPNIVEFCCKVAFLRPKL